MTRTGQNFSMYSGNSKIVYFTITDRIGKAIKLEGATLKWVMKQRGRTLANKILGDGISITDNDKGRVAVRIKPEDTHDATGDCDHELQLVDGDGNVSTVSVGVIHVVSSLIT